MRNFWQSFWAVFAKELLRLRRNPALIRTLVILQLADIFSVGWLDLNVREMPIVVVDQDHTAESRAFVARLGATATFRVKYLTSSAEQARSHIRGGRAKAAVIIPPDYGRRRSAGRNAEFLTIVDGSDSTAAAQVTATIDALAVDMGGRSTAEVSVGAREAAPVVAAHGALLFNPSGSTALYMLPGLLALTVAMTFFSQPLDIALEREEGSFERLLMTPMSPYGVMLGMIMPSVVLAILNGVVFLLLMRFGFDVPIRGSLLWLLVGLVLYVLTFLSLSGAIAAGAKNSEGPMVMFMFLNMAMSLLSGYIFPLSSIPKWLLPISYVLPQTHFIEIMRGMCLRGSTVGELAPHFIFLAVAPIVLTIVAGRRFASCMMDE